MKSNFTEPTYSFLSLIPKGKIVTYSQIAKTIHCKSPRLIGKILHANPDPIKYPCYKVVNSQGKVSSHYAFGGKNTQIKFLQKDGIEVVKDKVDLKKYLWKNK